MPRIIHTARTTVLLAALIAAALAAAAPGAGAMTLYDGTYSTDLSSSAPGGLSPADGSTSAYPAAFSLGWRSVAGATTYEIQVARQGSATSSCTSTSAFQSDNLVVTATTTQTTWIPALSSAATGAEVWLGTYCWRVRTQGSPAGSWSAGTRFSRTWTGTPTSLKFYNDIDGPIPRSSSSFDYTSGSATTRNAGYFDWNAVSGAATYEIEVASSQSFSPGSIMLRRKGVVGTRMVSLHLPDDTYYFRVRAIAPNGTEGGWSAGSSAFTVAWDDPAWDDQSKIFPTDSAPTSDLLLGWTPVPGAAWYEYQVATQGGCFWNSTTPELAPNPWGDWVHKTAVYNDFTIPATYRFAYKPEPRQCRLSAIGATTINNYVSMNNVVAPEVWDNLNTDCYDEAATPPKVICLPASFPTSVGVDRDAAIWKGSEMAPGDEDQPPVSISWRVRPVFKVAQGVEDGWQVSQGGLMIYGSWSRYTGGGVNRTYRTNVDPGAAVYSSTGVRCEASQNPGSACLAHIGESMQADEPIGAATAKSLQIPVVTWKPFPGAGGYIVQYATDPLFNNTVKVVTTPIGYAQSYVPTDGMVDNSEGTGYWWRVLPCGFPVNDAGVCLPRYNEDSGGLSPAYSDMAVAQTYQKQTAMQVKVTPSFNGATPLIQWAASEVAANDYKGWSTGMEGTDHYELQLARDPFMTSDLHTILTTTPRAVPFEPGASAGLTAELADGIWYFRVRAIDKGGLGGEVDLADIKGAWSDVRSFNKRILAPEPSVSGGGPGAGVTVSWTPVEGSTLYTVQWSTTSAFTNPMEDTTRQTTYRIPSTKPGNYFWRVRARIGNVDGLWSAVDSSGPRVTIVSPTRITFAVNKAVIPARDYAMLDGQLLIAGVARNGKAVQLQAKSRGCDSPTGSYTQVAQATTGTNVDDGMVRFRIRALSNACLRLAWTGDEGVHYSAPIPIKSQPVLSFTPSERSVLRGTGFCGQATSNVPISGRVRVQYRISTGWVTARTSTISGRTSWRQCAAINRAGSFPLRIVVDLMRHPTQGWLLYQPTSRTSGTIRVNDSWTVS